MCVCVCVCVCAKMEEGRSAFKTLTDKPTANIPLGRLTYIWEDNIRMDLKEISMYTRNWVDSESPYECGTEPPDSISHGASFYIYIYINLGQQCLGELVDSMPRRIQACINARGRATGY